MTLVSSLSSQLDQSVIAVPPLARDVHGAIDQRENEKIVRFIEAGGISLLLYGGNANIYHLPMKEYEPLLGMLTEIQNGSTRIIPSAGPTFGLLMDHATILRQFSFPTVMVLPQHGVTTSAGVATGIRRFVEMSAVSVMLYIKQDDYIDPGDVAKLTRDGLLSAIKYATVRDDPESDSYLRQLVDLVDPSLIVSGIGEQPAIIHMREFGLAGFTTGCGCLAPTLSQALLQAIRRNEWDQAERIQQIFMPLEALRNTLSPIRVLHEAVQSVGIATTGPLLPLLNNIEECHTEEIAEASRDLVGRSV